MAKTKFHFINGFIFTIIAFNLVYLISSLFNSTLSTAFFYSLMFSFSISILVGISFLALYFVAGLILPRGIIDYIMSIFSATFLVTLAVNSRILGSLGATIINAPSLSSQMLFNSFLYGVFVTFLAISLTVLMKTMFKSK